MACYGLIIVYYDSSWNLGFCVTTLELYIYLLLSPYFYIKSIIHFLAIIFWDHTCIQILFSLFYLILSFNLFLTKYRSCVKLSFKFNFPELEVQQIIPNYETSLFNSDLYILFLFRCWFSLVLITSTTPFPCLGSLMKLYSIIPFLYDD